MAAELQLTPSQTVGPFFSIGLTWPDGPYAVPEGAEGSFWIRGRVLDGDGDGVPDDPRGARGDFRGFARSSTDADGRFGVLTVKPGAVPGPAGTTQAPHLAVSVFARGLLNRVVTRIYFADEPELNATDPVLQSVPADRRGRLMAEPAPDGGYRFDVVLQGADETVFFAV
jgi:protocatechuate 3,4-dioxygenase alpha subunit